MRGFSCFKGSQSPNHEQPPPLSTFAGKTKDSSRSSRLGGQAYKKDATTMAKSQSNEGKDIFSLERLRQLIDLMKEHDLGEIDLQQDAQRIRLTRGSLPTMTMPAVVASAPPAPTAAPALAAPSTGASDLEGPHIVTIKSPMVGTFYARPNPNSKNYVEVGSSIQPDTTICIIEAMKVFNEIPAEVRGKIVSVLVQNEEAVDFGRPLFKVDTRG